MQCPPMCIPAAACRPLTVAAVAACAWSGQQQRGSASSSARNEAAPAACSRMRRCVQVAAVGQLIKEGKVGGQHLLAPLLVSACLCRLPAKRQLSLDVAAAQVACMPAWPQQPPVNCTPPAHRCGTGACPTRRPLVCARCGETCLQGRCCGLDCWSCCRCVARLQVQITPS